MSASHSRKGSSRAALPRRSTRGPLDVDDPLSTSQSSSGSPAKAASTSSRASLELDPSLTAPLTTSSIENDAETHASTGHTVKDLSFLLDTSIYHPVSDVDIPSAYRLPLPSTPPANTPLDQIFSQLRDLMDKLHFLSGAHLAAIILTSGFVQPTDSTSIFRLLSIRYSALELSGNVPLAAQESKALQDLSSSFYYQGSAPLPDGIDTSGGQQAGMKHIMPFDLRLQALRLQGIGFGDPERSVSALFDLGMECREHLAQENPRDHELWELRLEEVGIRVVNALIDMGDFDCAKRTLRTMMPKKLRTDSMWTTRMALLLIRTGEIEGARKLVENSETPGVNGTLLQSFLEIANGDYDNAAHTLSQLTDAGDDGAAIIMAKQNLAVVYLYIGEIGKSRQIQEDLVERGHSFQVLTVNLATLYELTSDRSKDYKVELVNIIGKTAQTGPHRGFVNADFKL